MQRLFSALLISSGVLGWSGGIASVAAAELPPVVDRKIDFMKDVQPLLAKHCVSCHAEKKQESGLRLDRKSHALNGGDLGKVIVPGKSSDSRLIKLVAAVDPDHVMPPEGDRLSAEQVGILRAWIDQGVEWPDSADSVEKNSHWAYQPVKRPAVPTVKNADWGKSPIDAFILAEQEKHGLKPSPMADRFTLIRRLNLDLLGLPPSIAEVDEFVKDARPNAVELLVDRLLASKHFGERWGRHWLDMARYADSDGFEKDNARPDAYRWRDWVIDAINADMPFDQFTIEQLAGDLLPNATPLQKLATAFHRQTLTNTEGGTDQEQWRIEACFDRTETTGAVWLGLTIGCARCHSHKYDAIPQREYYQLFSFFNNGDETTTVVPKSDADVAAYVKAKAAHDANVAEVTAKLRAEQDKLGPALVEWEKTTQEQLAKVAANPLKLHALSDLAASGDSKMKFATQKDGSILVSGPNPETAIYTVSGTAKLSGLSGLRLDVLPDPSLPAKGPGRVAHGNFVLSEITLDLATKSDFSDARSIEFAAGKADIEQDNGTFSAAKAIDGKLDSGWAIAPQFGKEHWAVFTVKEAAQTQITELLRAAEEKVFVRIKLSQQHGTKHTIGRFKLQLQTGSEAPVSLPDAVTKALAVVAEKRTAAQRQQVLDHFSSTVSPTKELLAQRESLKKNEPAKPELTVRIVAQRTASPRQTFVLKRGDFLHPVKELEVEPAALGTLPPLKPRDAKARGDRLDLAAWLVQPDHPLTPRVTVNHVWRLLFGNGLVRTASDFGVRGDKPTHPELLDWLASEFMNPGSGKAWSRKGLIKQIVMSATYQQSSVQTRAAREVDPQNVWLARQNRLRVEGELVRDINLEVAGLLSHKIGGPSVYPPLPPGIAELSYAGNFKWADSKGEDRYRRGMYTFFKRTSPHPNLTTFDCPDANLTCVERKASNTPLQALQTLNNEQFSEAAKAFARRLLTTAADGDAARLTLAFHHCVARPPRSNELNELTNLLATARDWYRTHPDLAKSLAGAEPVPNSDQIETASWTATARILMNLDEFITRE